MRILYLSVHEVLEYDEVRMLRSLGHDVFSPGAYVCPDNRGDKHLRPDLTGVTYDPEDLRLYHACAVAGSDNKAHLSRELVERFDAVIYMHAPEWILANREATRGKRVIWRTIGQSIDKQESMLRPMREAGELQIVRYSPQEAMIPGYIGADAMIRFGKDPKEWCGWNGSTHAVLHVGQDVVARRQACSFDFVEAVTAPFARTVIGSGSEVLPYGKGRVPFAELQDYMRRYRCLIYTGTHPASYTLGFVEALMTGIPVIACGPIHGNDAKNFPKHPLYEVHQLLSDGAGFASDDPFALKDVIAECIRNEKYAYSMSLKGRIRALELFDMNLVAQQWKKFL